MEKPFLIFSLGGSLIVPNDINVDYLRQFHSFVMGLVKDYKIIIVCGGGYTARKYINAAKEIQEIANDELDWIGIKTTLINAQLVKAMFPREITCQFVVHDPTEDFAFSQDILVAGGWKPGCSTDFDAVLLAKRFGAKKMFNLSNIEFVYDSDPKKNPDAKRIENINWTDFRKIVGDEWDPGLNMPFDPIASKEAQALEMEVAILKGNDLENIGKAVKGEPFNGTMIHP